MGMTSLSRYLLNRDRMGGPGTRPTIGSLIELGY